MENTEYKIAKGLLEIEAVRLSPEKPFLWASGLHSPIYCDNRKALSYPAFRRTICEAMIDVINATFKDVDVIAGVATGAIAYGAIVAEMMGKPFVYIRSKAKDHGMGNQVEGVLRGGERVVVIEDLISTGQSSLAAVDLLLQLRPFPPRLRERRRGAAHPVELRYSRRRGPRYWLHQGR